MGELLCETVFVCVCVHVYVVCDLTEERERQTVRQTDRQ